MDRASSYRALGWGLAATFVVLFVLCFLAALLFPNAELTHNWLSLYSTRPMGLCVPKTSSVLIGQANRPNVSGDGRTTLLRLEPVGLAIQVKEPA